MYPSPPTLPLPRSVFSGAFYNSLVAPQVGLGNAGFELGKMFGTAIVSCRDPLAFWGVATQ